MRTRLGIFICLCAVNSVRFGERGAAVSASSRYAVGRYSTVDETDDGRVRRPSIIVTGGRIGCANGVLAAALTSCLLFSQTGAY